jgi:hypothetical protein
VAEIACAECNGRFHRIGAKQRFCSRYCYDLSVGIKNPTSSRKAYSATIFECKNCGSPFEKYSRQLYCSARCQRQFRRKTKPEWYREKYLRDKPASNARNIALYYKTRATTPWKISLSAAKVRAKQNGTTFDLTYKWAESRWTGYCELTGLPFVLGSGRRGPYSPSVDQIEPKKGYTLGNSRFVLWAINSMKGEGTDEQMIFIARALITKLDDRTS